MRTISGIAVTPNVFMPETKRVQFRFPRSKRRRIRKKWRKRAANFREEPVAWLIGGEVFCHPNVYEKFKRLAVQR